MITASLHAYRGFYPTYHGFYSQSLDDYQCAAALDPSFPYFQMWYAEQLLLRGLPEDRLTASRILQVLAGGSLVFQEALAMLEQMSGEQPSRELRDDITSRIAWLQDVLEMNDSMAVPELRPDLRQIDHDRNNPRSVLKALQIEREHLYRHIKAMESSKFWMLRQAWIGLKRRLGLAAKDPPQLNPEPKP